MCKRFSSSPPDILNVLRVAATFFVFLLHGRSYVEGIDESSNPLMFLTYTPAWAGVWIFIFISSYLLGNGFITKKYEFFDAQNGSLSIKKFFQFYIKRFIRLAPVYYLYCFTMELFVDPAFFWNNPSVTLRVLTFTFNGNGGISGMGHLWYLSLAMQIYLIIPFVYLGLGKIRTKFPLVFCFAITLLAGLAARLALNYYDDSWYIWYTWVYTFVGSNLDFVICGVLLAFITAQERHEAEKSNGSIIVDIQFVLLVLYNCYIYSSDQLFIYRYVLPTLYIISCSLLILQHHHPRKRAQTTAVHNWKYSILHLVDWFAPYTFAFYVLHIQMFNYFSRTFGTLAIYLNARLLIRYVFFFGVSFVMTLGGAVVLKYAVDGITARINKSLSF